MSSSHQFCKVNKILTCISQIKGARGEMTHLGSLNYTEKPSFLAWTPHLPLSPAALGCLTELDTVWSPQGCGVATDSHFLKMTARTSTWWNCLRPTSGVDCPGLRTGPMAKDLSCPRKKQNDTESYCFCKLRDNNCGPGWVREIQVLFIDRKDSCHW